MQHEATEPKTPPEASGGAHPVADGVSGFSQRVLRYFLTFLQTDFKRQQAPRRRIQLKSDVGFRTGMPLRKYASLYIQVWKFAAAAPRDGLRFSVPPGKYTAPISPTLRDLIRQHIAAIEPDVVTALTGTTIDFATARRAKAVENPERFIDSVQLHFAEATGQRLVQPLLALLEGPFREQAYSAIESVYDVESELTEAIVAGVLENLPGAVNTLLVKGEASAMEGVFAEFFTLDGLRARMQSFFDDFATADAFQEIRDLQSALRSAEQQSFYLYLCEIRFGSNAFPLFYVPGSFEFDDERREFAFEFDPHLYVNKHAIDWILQEQHGEAASMPISPVQDRIVYVDGERSFVDEMETVVSRLIPALDLAAGLDLRRPTLQQQSSTTLKVSNAAYFAIFDRSDEALLNDYEELLAAFDQEQSGAQQMFENIVRGFITENPVSVRDAVDDAWESQSIPDRLVAVAPIPLNEEQRKIHTAVRDDRCRYISVQGPPGTGKSHTITSIAFDAILSGKNVLILSDKTEALDVVQDKLETVIQRVRHGDDDFPNPILRLGKSGGTYNRLITASAREKIKTHHNAAKAHAANIEAETQSTEIGLKADIEQTLAVLSGIKLSALRDLHDSEREIDAVRPGLTALLQTPVAPTSLPELARAADDLAANGLPHALVARIQQEHPGATLGVVFSLLSAMGVADRLSTSIQSPTALETFSTLEVTHQQILMRYVAEYEALRMPLFGFLFRRARLQAVNMRLGAELPCPDPVDVHKRLADMKVALSTLGRIREGLEALQLTEHASFVYRLLRNRESGLAGASTLAAVVGGFIRALPAEVFAHRLHYGGDGFESVESMLTFTVKAVRYAAEWQRIASALRSLPTTDYVGTKSRLEQLQTARMTRVIDQRFIDFLQNKSATAKEIGGVIKAKQKFPENEFHHLSEAFPCIIAGIREYAEYVPLRQSLFHIVVIDEASQVSVAQALPALLRADKVIVFGDQKQFSNVKSAQASNAINASHLTDIEAYFRANVSDAATKLQRLRHFDVKKSILEFFDLIANYQIMLRKHFRGYQELISFSSKTFYDGQLQAIKIRSRPIEEVIRFEVLENVEPGLKGRNTNRAEADFILAELHRMLEDGEKATVGIITPFREQLKLLNEVLYRDSQAERFESEFKLKIMTFDTCQGEERDLIVFSMVATEAHDALNYIFPVTLDGVVDKIEEALKAQRLNVGFSRGKEGFLFVLSKPVESFRGGIGRVLMHYQNLLTERALPTAQDVDPSSPMEAKVLDWISKCAFYQRHAEQIEVIAQFPVGEYLRQLDPFYEHPAYRCDFLLRYYDGSRTLNVIIEYDGFAEHFVNRSKVHNGNWDHYYRPEDVERQFILESYGYKFLRLNRFNLGADPVETLSRRLHDLSNHAIDETADAQIVTAIKEDVESLADGSKKRCAKCGHIRALAEFWDPKLKEGTGGYGRHCQSCKNPGAALRNHRATTGRAARHGGWPR
ncbi:hypothetical protein OKW30_005847 [Paraburkholderia sp. Clong3]|uniref:DEAD/DEAH box helicase n=1 Tax=Paraburkholderia sp. Clong3 TaxID=2991061 RepID=UPI003D1C87F9